MRYAIVYRLGGCACWELLTWSRQRLPQVIESAQATLAQDRQTGISSSAAMVVEEPTWERYVDAGYRGRLRAKWRSRR